MVPTGSCRSWTRWGRARGTRGVRDRPGARGAPLHRVASARRPWRAAASSSATRGSEAYRLGARLVGLAATAVARLPVVSQARPELEWLSSQTSETANLAILRRSSRRVRRPGDPGADGRDGELGGPPEPRAREFQRQGDDGMGRSPIAGGAAPALASNRSPTAPSPTPRGLRRAARGGAATGLRRRATESSKPGSSRSRPRCLAGGRAVAAVSISGRPTGSRPVISRGLGRAVRDAAAAVGHRMSGRAITAGGSSPRSRSG